MIKIMALTLSATFFVACASTEKLDTNTAEGAFALAAKYEKDERYEESITYYTEVKNKFPYSNLATEAELKIADIDYLQEDYPEAETAYRIFKELHPDHDKNDYVTFRLGMSVFNQLPASVDRDLALANTAIGYFSQVHTNYPKSQYVKESLEYKKKAEQMLADKVNYIANFYFIRKKWLSALGRYEDLIRNHPNLGYDTSALFGATIAAYRLKDMDKAKLYFKRLLAEHPNSPELEKARKELSDGF